MWTCLTRICRSPRVIRAGGFACRAKVEIKWVPSDDCATPRAQAALGDVDGILVPGGFGIRGIEGKSAPSPTVAARDSAARSVSRAAVRGD